MNADRNLLLGILALQLNFIDRHELVSAFDHWTSDPTRPLADVLESQGALGAERRVLLESLVVEHLKRHDDDPRKSLAAASSARDVLGPMGDTDLTMTLHRLRDGCASVDGATVPWTLGDSTSLGTRYRILRPHARGGLGDVFVAHDQELHREVALKQIRSTYHDQQEAQARFLLEAEITGSLEHPGIVPVYGLGHDGDGRPFYAMRLIRGDSLKDAIDRFHGNSEQEKAVREQGTGDSPQEAEGGGEKGKTGREENARFQDPKPKAEDPSSGQSAIRNPQSFTSLEFRQLLARFIDVCNAVEYAHSRGVLHRDLKPANIMLGKYGETLVVDWGLAKPLGRRGTHTLHDEQTLQPTSASGSSATQAGSAIGTPQYMSPEQAAGKLDELGPSSDVYNLGATLYCLLAGRPPFSESSVAQVIGKVASGTFSRPRHVQRHIPRALEAICLKAMAQAPSDRYVGATDLAADLEHWLADEPVCAYREPAAARIGRWARHHRPLVAGGAALLSAAVVALALGIALLGREQARTEERRREAVAAGRLADENAARAELARQRAQESAERANQQSRLALVTLQSVVFDIQTRLRDVPAAHAARGSMLKTAIEGLKRVARSAELATTEDHSLVAAHLDMAGIFFEAGGGEHGDSMGEAQHQYERALAIARRLAAAEPKSVVAARDLAMSEQGLGDVAMRQGRVDFAIESFGRALAIQEELAQGNGDDPQAARDLIGLHERLGDAQRLAGNSVAAQERYEAALLAARRLPKSSGGDDAWTMRAVAVQCERLGDLALELGAILTALESYNESLHVRQKLAEGPGNRAQAQRELAQAYLRTGGIQQRLGQPGETQAAYRRSLEIFLALAGADPANAQLQRDVAVGHEHVGIAGLELDQPAAALRSFMQAREGFVRLAAADPGSNQLKRDVAVIELQLGNAHLRLGESAAARDDFDRARTALGELTAAQPENAEYQRDLAVVLQRLGEAELALGGLQVGREHYLASADIFQSLADADPANAARRRDLAVSIDRLGDVSLKLNDVSAACKAFRRGHAMRQTLFDGDPRDARSRRDLMLSCRRLVELGRRTGEAESARQCLMETIGKLERLADGGPADTALRRDLARAHEQLGGLLVVLNDFDSARGSYERALGIYLPLAADTGDIEAQSDLADAYQALGYCEQLAMRFDQALPWYDRALELFARLDAAGQLADRPVLNETLERVRHESDETRAAAGAVESLDWALEQPAALVPRLLYMRSVVLARRGQHPLAAQAAAKLAELLPDDPSAQYDAACGFALAAAVGHDDETPAADENAIRDGYAARAMELLRHAVEAGYADLVHMRHDSDLRALAERDDFRAFLRELEGEHD